MRKMIAFAVSIMIAAHAAAQDGCVRSKPDPVFPKADARIHSFISKSPTEAIETLRLASGDVLRLELGGCEYFVLTLEFAATANPNPYSAAAKLLDSLRPQQPEAGFDLALAASTLRAMGAKGTPLGEEAAVAGDGEDFLQARLKLEQAKGKLRLRLFRGPL